MMGRMTAAAVLGAGLVLGAPVLAQDYADYGSAKGWAVQAISMDGSFMRCEAMNDSLVFMLAYSTEGWMVTVDAVPGNPAEVDGFVDIDRASFPATFYQLADGRYGAFMDDGMAASMRAGSYVVLDVGGQTTEGPLVGSAAAMGKLEECVNVGGVGGSAAAAPAPAPAPEPAPAPQPVESDAARMDATCPNPRQFASPPSNQPATIEFVNQSDIAISLYWIDFDGNLQEYAGTLPGEAVTLDSYVGHTWLAKDFNGTCHSSILVVYPQNTRYELY